MRSVRGADLRVAERSGSASAMVRNLGTLSRLFRNTGLYGRALGELVPLLAWWSTLPPAERECVPFHERVSPCNSGPAVPTLFPSRRAAPITTVSWRSASPAEVRRLGTPVGCVLREPKPIAAGAAALNFPFRPPHRFDSHP